MQANNLRNVARPLLHEVRHEPLHQRAAMREKSVITEVAEVGPPVRFVQNRPLGSIPIAGVSCKSASTRAVGQSDSRLRGLNQEDFSDGR